MTISKFTLFIALLNGAAIVLALLMYGTDDADSALAVLVKSLLFSWVSVGLLLKPYSIDFVRSIRNSSGENHSSANVKVAKITSALAAIFNAFLSLAFYLHW